MERERYRAGSSASMQQRLCGSMGGRCDLRGYESASDTRRCGRSPRIVGRADSVDLILHRSNNLTSSLASIGLPPSAVLNGFCANGPDGETSSSAPQKSVIVPPASRRITDGPQMSHTPT